MLDQYCNYLRKSRSDIEAERNGIDTLERHEHMLNAYAAANNLIIGKTYREVVSGDTIAARPQMQQLLQDVEDGKWKGVLVVEVERLARGDTIDQGIIAQVFKFSGTLIVTPSKTYDPSNEYDEEFFEYGLFQSRREYKAITRRQQRGRKISVEEGKWPYNKAPFGYERYKLPSQKGWSLNIVPEQADVIRQLFNLYATGNIGYSAIAQQFNDMHVPGPSGKWSYSTAKDILTNIVYTGKVKYGYRGVSKKTVNGVLSSSRPRNNEYEVYDGLHEAIIDDALFQKVQDIFKTHPAKPLGKSLEIKNPLAGLVYCSMCGRKMIRRPQDRCRTMIICTTKGCPNVAVYETTLESAVIEGLKDYLEELKTSDAGKEAEHDTTTIKLLKNTLTAFEKEIDQLNNQLNNAYDLVEQGVYTSDLFLKRSKAINDKLEDCITKKDDIEKKLKKEQRLSNTKSILIPKLENALRIYDSLEPKQKNSLLTDIIESIDYTKTERSQAGKGDIKNFDITIHPRFPS